MGVNKYKLEKEVPIEVLSIDNSKVIAVQRAKLEKLHTTRDKAAAEAALNALTECASGAGMYSTCTCTCTCMATIVVGTNMYILAG